MMTSGATSGPESAGAWERARRAGYGPAEYIDQQGFMLARDIRALAAGAGITSGTRVLDLCCGRGGPGRLVTRELGCHYLGVDADPMAVSVARERAGDLMCRYEVGRLPPLPQGSFDVVLLLETMLAFRDKEPLLRGVRAALDLGGRFAFTLEAGEALTPAERAVMPASGTVWPIPWPDLQAALRRAGLEVTGVRDVTEGHRRVVDSLLRAVSRERAAITEQTADAAVEELVAGHQLWSRWLRTGRVRKFAVLTRAAQDAGPA